MEIEKIVPKDGPTIDEFKKYIDKYKDQLIVIKYGGNVFIDRNIFNNFISDISILNNAKADRGDGAVKINKDKIIDVEPDDDKS